MGCPYEVTFYSPGKTVRFKSNDANNTSKVRAKMQCKIQCERHNNKTKQKERN